MPSLLQPRLKCFYCGMRSQYTKDGRTREFLCTSCTATNYLDSNGDITDPPATPKIKANSSFAHARNQTSPIQQPDADHLFCKNCLKNQQLLTNNLAEYLPSEDDPNYAKFEAEYPEYRKNLELRYPQVCLKCAPRVQKHLNKTAYQAKVDFLTRKIEHSKSNLLSNTSATTSLLILALNLASMAWWGSALVQSLWHAFAFAGINGDNEQVTGLTPLMLVGCSVNAARSGLFPAGCANLLVHLVRKSLILSLLLLWWNPAIKDKLRYPARTHQASGIADFYRFQTAIMAFRATAWWTLHSPWLEGSTSPVTKGIHGCSLLLILLSSVASIRMVGSSAAPKVSFKPNNAPLVDPNSFQYPEETFASMPSNQRPTASPSRQPFPLSNLGNQRNPQFASPKPSYMPTPASDTTLAFDHPDDSMDWEPIDQSSSIRPQHTAQFSPASAIPSFLRPAPSMVTGEKSPFTGRLPPAPMSPAHRLRNPPAPPQFKPAPMSQQTDFFKKMGLASKEAPILSKKPANKTAGNKSDDSASHTYLSSVDKSKTKDNFDLRPAQWTLKSDMEAATKGTGLEDMFTTSFRIADEPGTGQGHATRDDEGDGRDMFGAGPRRNTPASTESATDIVQRNLKDAVLPIGLAVCALVLAVLRDPAAREWLTGLWENGLGLTNI